MASSCAPRLSFQESEPNNEARPALSSATPALHGIRVFAPKLVALGGLALFGAALVIAFRIITLDAAHQLSQPAIDFAICGAIAFLGLTISWVQLGEAEGENILEMSAEMADEPSLPPAANVYYDVAGSYQAPAATATLPSAQPRRPRWFSLHTCGLCGGRMQSLGSAQYQCRSCRHLEDRSPLSFLD